MGNIVIKVNHVGVRFRMGSEKVIWIIKIFGR